MPDVQYLIDYATKVDGAIANIDRLKAKVIEFDQVVERSEQRLANYGRNLPGIAAATTQFASLMRTLTALDRIGDKTHDTLETIGKNTGSMTSAISKARDLAHELNNVAQAGTNATNQTANVGQGIGGGGGGGGGGKGSGNSGMFSGYKGVVRRVLTAAAVHQGLRAARAYAQTMAEGQGDERGYSKMAAKAAQDYRESLKEVSSIEGGGGVVSDDLMREQMRLTKNTASSSAEALAGRINYSGAVETAIATGNVAPKVAKDMLEPTLLFANRTNTPAEAAGQMVGLLGNHMKIPTVDAGMSKIARMQAHLNLFGVGDMNQLAPALKNVLGEMAGEGGPIADPEMVSAMLAYQTKNEGPLRAATTLRQAQAGRQKLNGKFGITAEDDLPAALRKLRPNLAGKSRGQQGLLLNSAGAGNTEQVGALLSLSEGLPIVEKQMQDPRIVAAGTNWRQDNQTFLDSEQGRNAKAEATLDEATVERGMKGEVTERLRTEARARLTNAPDAWNRSSTWQNRWKKFRTGLFHLGAIDSEQELVDQNIIMDLQERGKKVGYDLGKQHPDLVDQTGDPWFVPGGGRNLDTDTMRNTELGRAATAIEALEVKLRNGGGNGNGNPGVAPVRQ